MSEASPINSQANFADMRAAGEQFQNALEECQRIQGAVDGTKTSLARSYYGDENSSSAIFYGKFTQWQQDFDVVRGALARMVLELADANSNYEKQEDVNKEIAAAISAQLS
jgi:hypothetical protein